MTRRWIVTGGSRGVGLAVASLALARGDSVAVFARKVDVPELVALQGPRFLALTTDIADRASIDASVAAVHEAWGGVDVLVN
ncbi:MAG: SDR family NAD(P)-dependent oxidoreductase, partial [Gammaproteobacteria bacterium]